MSLTQTAEAGDCLRSVVTIEAGDSVAHLSAVYTRVLCLTSCFAKHTTMLSKGLTAATAASCGAARRVCQVHQCFGNHASTSLTQQLCSRSQESGPAAYPYTIDHKAVASRGLRAFGTRMVVACAADGMELLFIRLSANNDRP
jgi:hypothetical protein